MLHVYRMIGPLKALRRLGSYGKDHIETHLILRVLSADAETPQC